MPYALSLAISLPLVLALASPSPPRPPRPYDADAAVRAAIEHARSLRVERRQLERARKRAGHVHLKDVVVGVEHDGLFQASDPRPPPLLDNTLASASWAPPALEDLGLQQSIDDAEADADEVDLDKKARSIAAEVRRVHARIVLLREERALMEKALDVARRIDDATAAKLRAEQATQVDASIATLDMLEMKLDLDEVDAHLARNESRFARLVGGDTDAGADEQADADADEHGDADEHDAATSTAASAPTAPTPTPTATATGDAPTCAAPKADDELYPAARVRSAKLRRLASEKDALALRDARSLLGYLPWIDQVRVGYRNARPYDGKGELQVGVAIGVPLFRILDGYTGQAADLRRARVEAEIAEEEEDVKSDLAAKVLRQRTAATLYAEHEQAMTTISAQSTAAVDAALAAGGADIVGAATVHARALKAQRALLKARERCVDAVIDVWESTGDVLPAEH